MKCIKCGNLISDESTVCPYCNTPVETNVNEVNNVPVEQNVNSFVSPVTPNNNVVETQVVEQNVMNTTPVEKVAEQTPVVENAVMNDMNQNPVSTPVQPVMESINPEGNVTPMVEESIKYGNTAPVKEVKEVDKKKLTKIGIIAAILVLLIGCCVGFYFYEYKSADTRIERILNGSAEFTKGLTNEKMEVGSGKYEFDASVDFENQSMKANISGMYAMDIPNELIDYTVNVNNIEVQGQKLLNESLSVEFSIIENKLYLLLQNFYDKYIYQEVPGLDEIFKTVQQNDINYVLLINGLKNALIDGMKTVNKDQGIESAKIDGKDKKVNLIRVTFTENNIRLFLRGLLSNIVKNQAFITEVAKIAGEDVTADNIKSKINESLANLKDFKVSEDYKPFKLEFYTAIVGNDYYGMKLISDENILEVVNNSDGSVKLIGYEKNKKMLELTVSDTEKKNSATIEKNIKINGSIYSGETSFNIDLTLNVVEDINPKVEKPNVKKAVSLENISPEELKSILTKIKGFGNLGLLLSDSIDGLIESIPSNETVKVNTLCAQAVSCNEGYNPDGTVTCTYCDGDDCTKTVTCPVELR